MECKSEHAPADDMGYVQATSDFEQKDHPDSDNDYLAFFEGTLIKLLGKPSEHWWYGRVDERQGFIPSSYVEEVKPEPSSCMHSGSGSTPGTFNVARFFPPTMMYKGSQWVRIWHQGPVTGDQSGGVFDVSAKALNSSTQTGALSNLQLLAKSLFEDEDGNRKGSIHVRVANDPDKSVTLKYGVTWPLEQLVEGRAFSSLPDGSSISKAKAFETWEGSMVDQMWNKDHLGHKTLSSGVLYKACGNGNGLRLVENKYCEFQPNKPAAVEVWVTNGSDGSTDLARELAEVFVTYARLVDEEYDDLQRSLCYQ